MRMAKRKTPKKKTLKTPQKEHSKTPWDIGAVVLGIVIIVILFFYYSDTEKLNLPQDLQDPYLLVIKCEGCDTETMIHLAKDLFPGLYVHEIQYPSPEADSLIRDLGIETLPTYIFSKSIRDMPKFDSMKDSFNSRKDHLVLRTRQDNESLDLN